MKGFGSDKNNNNKKVIKKPKNIDKDKLIANAFEHHSKGEIKKAFNIYKYLIDNKYYDSRIFTNLGSIYLQLKQFDKAILLYQESIKKFPNNPESYSNLARILIQKGKNEIAKKYLNEAIRLDPKYLMAYSNLVNICVNEGKLEQAEIYLRKSIEINPKSIDSFVNLGCVLKDLGNSYQAEKFLREALKINPEHNLALINLGAVLSDLGKIDEGEKVLKKSLKINSISPNALNNLGNILIKKNKLKEAELCFREAIKIKSNFSLAYNNLGSLLSRNGNLTDAEIYTEKAIAYNPNYELAYVNLGTIKIDLDKLSEAEELFLKAIEIKHNYNFAYSNLFRLYEKTNNITKLRKQIDDLNKNIIIANEILMFKARIFFRDKNYTKAKQLIDQIPKEWIENTDENTKLLFWSFKGFIEEKVKNYDEAYRSFKNSQLNLKYENCDPKLFQNYIHSYRRNLDSKEFIEKDEKANINNDSPVFLIGFPRSGTTLLDTILRSHPEIDVLEEKPIINSVERIIKSKFKYSLSEIYKLNQNELKILRKHYLDILKNNSDKSKNSKIIIDKFPFQTVCLPLINLLFPNAKIIFTHRNPYDTVLSCFQQSFEPNNAMSNFRSINSASIIYDLTMNMWVEYKNKLNIQYVTSKYEDLIDDFDSHIPKILDFLNINWDENLKNYRDTAFKRGKINTPSSSQVIQPLYKTSIKKWKNYEKYFEESKSYLIKWEKYFNY